MVSDDTEHAAMTLLSLHECEGDPDLFAKALAKRLRWWLAGIPAGVGFATVRSILKLWLGAGPEKSGVWSAGNGPMMRAPLIGVYFAADPAKRKNFTEISTRITHRDPRAGEAARMIAEAAALACAGEEDEGVILGSLGTLIRSEEMKARFGVLHASLAGGEAAGVFADRIGRRKGFVSGFAPDSAAVALYAWLKHRRDFRGTIESVVRAGGDTDTVAFIAGSLAGIDCDPQGMPRDWIEGLKDGPFHEDVFRELDRFRSLRYPNWPGSILRNAFFLSAVIGHVFRRMLPPY